jgi:hypothetical protein
VDRAVAGYLKKNTSPFLHARAQQSSLIAAAAAAVSTTHCICKNSGLQKSIQQMTTGEIDNLIHNDHMIGIDPSRNGCYS